MNNKGNREKLWILKSHTTPENEREIRKIASTLGINPIVAKLLYTRGYKTPADAKSFLCMESEMLANPFDMKDIDSAVERIRLAINRGEKITIYGDYDVDGVTSVCTLYLYLRSKGGKVDYYIPNRAGEGYGVSVFAIDAIKENGTSLIITVDTGITATEEVEYAKQIGVDFIVTDHHECCSEIPNATAVVNPHRADCPYPFKELAGVGVVFKLISAYEEKTTGASRAVAATRIFEKYADLVAIGTIADVMPIKGENRIIVSYGLKMIQTNPRPALSAIIEASSASRDNQRSDRRRKMPQITSGYIGYTLAPRINAAGRIRTASMAVELFLSENYENTYRIAEELCNANKERQNEENKIMKEVYQQIEQGGMDKDAVIVLSSNNWHHGVIGIVASRITERYSKPCILVSFEGNSAEACDTDIGKGSGRSVKGINLVDALCHCGDLLVKFGGHELAAGLSVERGKLDDFRKKINEFVTATFSDIDASPAVEVDCEISYTDITFDLATQLRILEPYGVGNPVPVFIVRDVPVSELSGIGDGKHTKIILSDGRNYLTAMYFSNSPESVGVYPGDMVDVMFNLDINEWSGRQNVQLLVRDIKHSSSHPNIMSDQPERFEEIWGGAPFTDEECVIPSREDFVAVYKLISASLHNGVDRLSHREIMTKLSSQRPPVMMGYIKLKVIIKVLIELNIVNIEERDEVYKFSIHYTSAKTDLEKSGLLKRLRKQKKY